MHTPKKRKRQSQTTSTMYQRRIQYLQKKLNAKNAYIFCLKKKIRNVYSNLATNKLPKVARIFVNMQLHHKQRHLWTKDEKQIALCLYYKSPTLYLFMRETLRFILPSKSTIASWVRLSQLSTGTDTPFFEKLKTKVETMSQDEKECVLLMDEMSIKKGVEYNSQKDFIEGFEDLGHIGRENKIATQALVFMARGLITKWKIPISYYLSATSVRHQHLFDLVIQNIKALQNAGLKVRVLICDQAATNRAVFQTLGVTEDQPFFIVNGKKVFSMYDVPHLIKSVRNNLMSQNIYAGEKRTSWDDITDMYIIDKASNSARAVPRINDCHINPNTFQKMRVKYATQIFSRTVSAAITTCVKTGQLKRDSALNTAEFLLNINNLFDSLNSRVLNHSNKFQSALSVRKPELISFLQEIKNWIATWQAYSNSNKVKKGIYCFQGFQLSINTTLLLWKDLVKDGYTFLLTSRLNQDPLENLFSTNRRRNGNNTNPTGKSFRQALQWNMLMKLLKPPKNSNCEMDNDEVMEIDYEKQNVNDDYDQYQTSVKNVIIEDEDQSSAQHKINYSNSNKATCSLETCATSYLAGYVVYKTLKKFKCKECSNLCLKEPLNDKSELFLLEKDYSKDDVKYLKFPTESVKNVTRLIPDSTRVSVFNERTYIDNVYIN